MIHVAFKKEQSHVSGPCGCRFIEVGEGRCLLVAVLTLA